MPHPHWGWIRDASWRTGKGEMLADPGEECDGNKTDSRNQGIMLQERELELNDCWTASGLCSGSEK